MIKRIHIPAGEEEVRSLRAGDMVEIHGIGITARDTAHKYMVERFIEEKTPLTEEDTMIYRELKRILNGGFIYHCGPIVRYEDGRWRFVSAGPTTSIRTEVYQDRVIDAFGVRLVIGKGGMGERTLEACRQYGAVYVQAVGGAGVLNANSVTEVIDVFKKDDFGLPEAIWVIKVQGLAGIVTMDSTGRNIYEEIRRSIEQA